MEFKLDILFRSHSIFFIFIEFFLIILVYLLLLTPLNSTAQQQVLVDPEEIKITVSDNELDKIRDTRIYLSPIQINISNVKVLSTDLKSDQENWIESSKIKINPKTIDLVSGHVANLTLNFEDLDSKPGAYSGNLFLTSPALTTIKIPLTVTIHSDARIALFLVGLGVITNFLLKFFQLKVKEKQKGTQSLDAAIMKHNEVAQLNKQVPPQVTAKESIDLLGSVMSDPQQPVEKRIIQPGSVKPKPVWFLTRPVRGDYAAYAGLTLGLLISVLLVWQEYFSKLSVFGIFPIDYISAFLFGFGSQAILISETLDFAKIIKD
jgi:hypothetical protein